MIKVKRESDVFLLLCRVTLPKTLDNGFYNEISIVADPHLAPFIHHQTLLARTPGRAAIFRPSVNSLITPCCRTSYRTPVSQSPLTSTPESVSYTCDDTAISSAGEIIRTSIVMLVDRHLALLALAISTATVTAAPEQKQVERGRRSDWSVTRASHLTHAACCRRINY